MKTIFLITTLLSLQLKADIPVENPVETVDKEYQHQITCKAFSQNQEYELMLKWKKLQPTGQAPYFDEGFSFQIKSLTPSRVGLIIMQIFLPIELLLMKMTRI